MATAAPLAQGPSAIHVPATEDVVFQAALETVRALPGWEVLTAHPEDGEIRAQARGRLFSPTLEHVVRIAPGPDGTDLALETMTRDRRKYDDEQARQLFTQLLTDRLQRHQATRAAVERAP